jgi:hypothetical protein
VILKSHDMKTKETQNSNEAPEGPWEGIESHLSSGGRVIIVGFGRFGSAAAGFVCERLIATNAKWSSNVHVCDTSHLLAFDNPVEEATQRICARLKEADLLIVTLDGEALPFVEMLKASISKIMNMSLVTVPPVVELTAKDPVGVFEQFSTGLLAFVKGIDTRPSNN